MKQMIAALTIAWLLAGGAYASPPMTLAPNGMNFGLPVVKVASCKSYRICAAAVKAWCAGRHNSADRDGDRIPCENVCKSLKQARREARKIGCKRSG